jgi:hypothetical protein
LRQTAQISFETKLLEMALQAPTPRTAISRAKTFAETLNNLGYMPPKDFGQKLQAYEAALKRFRNTTSDPDEDRTVETKMQMIKLIAEHPDHKQEIVNTWRVLFPGDDWVSSLATENTTTHSKTTHSKTSPR